MCKKIISIVLALVLSLSILTLCVNAKEGDIIVNESYTILASDNRLTACANKLQGYIKKITGYELAIVTEAGSSPYISLNIDPENEVTYSIKESEGNIIITGNSLSQAVRGAYALLEQYGGVKCYTSKLTSYNSDKISVPAGTDYKYNRFFEYAETDWLSPRDTDYSLFNGLNGAEYRKIPDELGGMTDYISGFAHTLSSQWCSEGKYFEEHPEYFALSYGKRTGKQLCLSNPEVLKIVTQEVLDLLKTRHDPDAELQIVSLTQDDNIAYCKCKDCRETDRKYGSHAGTMLEFVNAVAKEVKKAGYDNVAIDTFAYRYTRKPPKGIVPDDNVIVRLCSIECCFTHTFDDESCKANKSFMDDLKGWSEICDRVYIWDYCTNFTAYVGPFPDFGVLQKDIQFFYENNVKGIYEEGNYSMDVCDTEFGELRAYMIAKLFQNPYCDIEKEKNDFLNAYYGEGGKYIKEFLDIMTESASKGHLGIYQSMGQSFSLSNKQVKECDALWEKAKEEATDDAKTNVLNSELCWRYWKMMTSKSEFSNPATKKKMKAKLTDDINATGIRAWNEFDGFRNWIVRLYQDAYFIIYPVLNAVLQLLYHV